MSGLSRMLAPAVLAAGLLWLTATVHAQAGADDTLRWLPPDTVTPAEIDTARLALPSWFHPPRYPGCWPRLILRRAGVDSVSGDTLRVRYRALSGSHRILLVEERR
jgi:hypothetical protein